MSGLSTREWMADLADLGTDDLRRINRLVDLLITAEPAIKATASVMLDAGPKPATAQDARARIESTIEYWTTKRRWQSSTTAPAPAGVFRSDFRETRETGDRRPRQGHG